MAWARGSRGSRLRGGSEARLEDREIDDATGSFALVDAEANAVRERGDVVGVVVEGAVPNDERAVVLRARVLLDPLEDRHRGRVHVGVQDVARLAGARSVALADGV